MDSKNLDMLEDRIVRILEMLQKLKTENKEIRQQNSELLMELDNLQKDNTKYKQKKVANSTTGQSELSVQQIKDVKTKIQGILSKLESEGLI